MGSQSKFNQIASGVHTPLLKRKCLLNSYIPRTLRRKIKPNHTVWPACGSIVFFFFTPLFSLRQFSRARGEDVTKKIRRICSPKPLFETNFLKFIKIFVIGVNKLKTSPLDSLFHFSTTIVSHFLNYLLQLNSIDLHTWFGDLFK